MTTSIFVEACGFEVIEDGVERVNSVVADEAEEVTAGERAAVFVFANRELHR